MLARSSPTIMFIGGPSCCGKSTLARALGARLNARVVDADLFWMTLQRVLPPDHVANLFQSEMVWSLPHDDLLDRYLRVSTFVSWALEAVVAHYSNAGVDAVIEGCWVLPEFAGQPVFADRANSARLKPLFLHEPSAEELRSRLFVRDDGWQAQQTPAAQANHVRMQWEFGNEIKRRAEVLAMPVIESRPFDTLLERALEALELEHD